MWLALATVTASAGAQTAAERFAVTFKDAVRLVGEVKGSPKEIRSRASVAFHKLEEAGHLVVQLPPQRRAFARFFLSVWRAEVHLRVGQTASLQAAVAELTLARRHAHAAGVYETYYRVQCSIVLWQCAAPSQFEELVQQFGDREYLLSQASESALTENKAGAAELIWPLRLLRCDLRLSTKEQAVVDEWRVLAEKIKGTQDPDLLPWRDVCLGRLIWYYLERRDYDRAKLFVDELPADKARYPRVLIASKRHDYETVVREGLILAKAQKIYLQLVADAREAMGDVAQALGDLEQVLAIPGLGAVDRASALNRPRL